MYYKMVSIFAHLSFGKTWICEQERAESAVHMPSMYMLLKPTQISKAGVTILAESTSTGPEKAVHMRSTTHEFAVFAYCGWKRNNKHCRVFKFCSIQCKEYESTFTSSLRKEQYAPMNN